jgi:hypothetical protein
MNRDVATKILRDLEVRDAMNLVQTGLNVHFAKIMKEDGIWKFWVKRDMEEVYTDFLPPWAEGEIIDGPRWKLVYLWYRLTYVVYQQATLDHYKAYKNGFLYPKGTKLKMARLNVIAAKYPNNSSVVELDFKTEYPKLLFDLGTDTSQAFFDLPSVMFREAFSKLYNIRYDSKNEFFYNYETILGNLKQVFIIISYARKRGSYADLRPIDFNLYGYKLDEHFYNIIKKFPREYKSGKILVGCAVCSIPTSIQCSCPCATPYCGKECQKEHHSLV